MSELFRKEAMSSQKSSWLGTISLARPVSSWIATFVAAAAGLTLALFFVFGHYTKRTAVKGVLVPDKGIAIVRSPLSGTVSDLRISEGALVTASSELAVINAGRSVSGGVDALSELKILSERRVDAVERLRSAKVAELAQRIESLEDEIERYDSEQSGLEVELKNREEQARLGRIAVEQYRLAAEAMLISRMQYTNQKQATLELENQAMASKRQLSALSRERMRLVRELALAETALVEAEASSNSEGDALRSAMLQVESENEVVLKAPVAGMVSSLDVELNQAIASGQQVLTVVPEGARLEAHFYVSSEAAGFVKRGDKVTLRYDAFPYQKYGVYSGRVVRVSTNSVDLDSPSNETPRRGFRVVVGLDQQGVRAYGVGHQLRPGMSVDADILGDERRIYQWVFEPLHSLRGL